MISSEYLRFSYWKCKSQDEIFLWTENGAFSMVQFALWKFHGTLIQLEKERNSQNQIFWFLHSSRTSITHRDWKEEGHNEMQYRHQQESHSQHIWNACVAPGCQVALGTFSWLCIFPLSSWKGERWRAEWLRSHSEDTCFYKLRCKPVVHLNVRGLISITCS